MADKQTQEEKVEEAKALLAADERAKADAAKKESDKVQAAAEKAERDAKTPQQRLQDDWPKKHREIAAFVTINGEVRGNLLIPDQQKAKKILKSYGFKVFKESGSKRKL